MKKKLKILSCALLSLGLTYYAKDCSYFHYPTSQDYKQEFKTDLEEFSGRLKRKYPRNAESKDTIGLCLYLDAEFKRNHDHWIVSDDNNQWKSVLENSLENTAHRFHDEFGINFEVKDVRYWDPIVMPDYATFSFFEQITSEQCETAGAVGISGKKTNDFT